MALSDILLLIAGLLVVVSLAQPFAQRLGLPYTVVLAVAGVLIGASAGALLHTDLTYAFDSVAVMFVDLPVTSEVFLYVFLPVLLFQASLTIDARRMAEDAAPILMLAVVAVLVTTAVVGLALWPVAGVPLVACLLLGAIIATTDPAAVVAIFRDIGAPARLTRLIEGESLLNDAAAIALFGVLLAILLHDGDTGIAHGLWVFLRSFVGGIVVGALAARGLTLLVPLLRDLRLAEVTLTVALPYLVYILCEKFLGVSGVVAVVAAGLTVGAFGRPRFSPETWELLDTVWAQLAFWASSLVFLFASILVPRLLGNVSLADVGILLLLVVAALAARAAVLWGLLPGLSAVGLAEKVSRPYKLAILWGGLRGAVTLALALAVTENPAIPPEIQHFVAVHATGFVLFTLLINGTTLNAAIRKVGLDKLSPLDQALRHQVLAIALETVRDRLRTVARDHDIAPPVLRQITRDYDRRVVEATSRNTFDAEIGDKDRLTIGLISLANRERELVLRHFGARTVSRRTVESLLLGLDRLIDAARADRRVGYVRAGRRMLAYGRGFRIALWLHRRLRITRPLTNRLADRFELLLVSAMLLDELRPFIKDKLSPVLGERMCGLIGDILGQRIEATRKELDALRLQYPDYAEALERRFLAQVAVRLEEREYRTLHEEALVGRELYSDLQRSLDQARAGAAERPRLDLGLEKQSLLCCLPLFAELDETSQKRVSKVLRPRFAVPGEVLIRPGETGDSVFFISSGAVEVNTGEQTIRLGRGDFFGEMALLNQRRRRSTVTALTFCQLLQLRDVDFRRFLDTHQDIRQAIDAAAASRAASNQAAAKAAE